MEPWQFVLLGVAAVSVGYSLFQGTKHRQKLQRQDAYRDTLEDVATLESSARGVIQKLEVRAYDYSREVEARIDNRLLVLDQLILDADREIVRLKTLLLETRQSVLSSDRELTLDEQQRCYALKEAGCSDEEIARCLLTTPDSVARALNEWHRSDRRAA